MEAEYIVLAAAIAGATELITRVRAKDYWVVLTIVTAAVIGGLFGATDYYAGLDVIEGIVYGFGASGAISALGAIGNKSIPKPSKALEK